MTSAIEFVDEHGLEAMTMRSLGEKIGVDPTAVYRHFPNKEDLVNAMADWFFGLIRGQLGADTAPARERILDIARTTRASFALHPALGVAAVHSTGNSVNGFHVTTAAIGCLEEIGVPAADLPVVYQALEGFVFGACLMDYIGSPTNWEVRRYRYRALEKDAFDAVAKNTDSVRGVADDAFARGFTTLLDSLTNSR